MKKLSDLLARIGLVTSLTIISSLSFGEGYKDYGRKIRFFEDSKKYYEIKKEIYGDSLAQYAQEENFDTLFKWLEENSPTFSLNYYIEVKKSLKEGNVNNMLPDVIEKINSGETEICIIEEGISILDKIASGIREYFTGEPPIPGKIRILMDRYKKIYNGTTTEPRYLHLMQEYKDSFSKYQIANDSLKVYYEKEIERIKEKNRSDSLNVYKNKIKK